MIMECCTCKRVVQEDGWVIERPAGISIGHSHGPACKESFISAMNLERLHGQPPDAVASRIR